jgi:hypothetical protein
MNLFRMRHRQSTIVLVAATIAACGDSTAPTRGVTLSLCSGTTWAGVQNEGRGWVTIADGPTDATVDATERLVVATITGGSGGQLAFYYLTRAQAQETFVCSPTAGGTKQLAGTVAGTSGGYTQIAMGKTVLFTFTTVSTFPTGFALRDLPDGPLDLVAVHEGTAIVRRRVNYPDGGTIPVLDFSSAEAFALQSHTLTIEPTALGAARWQTWVMTNGGTSSLLTVTACCTGGTIYSLPASHQESGDLYHLIVASGSVDDLRSVDGFYDTPSNQTVAFGPPASRATITTVAAPGQLWRAEIPSQPEYGSQIELVVSAPQPPSGITNPTTIAIRASKEYFGGTPAKWTFTVPDLSSVAGFPAGWPIVSAPQSGRVTAGDPPWGFSPSRARPGDVYRRAPGF